MTFSNRACPAVDTDSVQPATGNKPTLCRQAYVPNIGELSTSCYINSNSSIDIDFQMRLAEMVLQFDRDEIISKCSPAAVQSKLKQYALELAILGAVDEARSLFSLLFKSSWTTDASTAMMHGLCYAWHHTGKPPTGIAKKHKAKQQPTPSADSIIQEYMNNSRGLYEVCWGANTTESRTFDEKGLEACMAAMETDDQGTDVDPEYEVFKKSQVLVKALDISLRLLPPWVRIDRTEDTTTGTQVQTVEELDPRSHSFLIQIIDRWNVPRQISELGMAEKLWPLCLNGVIREAVGMSKEQVQTTGQELVEIFFTRLKKPAIQPDPFATSLRGTLQRAELHTLCGTGNDFWREYDLERRPDTYFHPGASEAELTQTEERLSIQLPNDYKQFLRTTNGFGSQTSGIYNGYHPEPELYPADQISWSAEEYFQLPVDLLGELRNEYHDLVPRSNNSTPRGNGMWDFQSLPLFDRVLQIGSMDTLHLWLVHPTLVKQAVNCYDQMYRNASREQKAELEARMVELAGSKAEFERWADGRHWCCVMWADGDMTAYSSFRSYIDRLTDESMVSKLHDDDDEE